MRRNLSRTSGMILAGCWVARCAAITSASAASSAAFVLGVMMPARIAFSRLSRSDCAFASFRRASSPEPACAFMCLAMACCHAFIASSVSSASRTPATIAASASRALTRIRFVQVPRFFAVLHP
nr:hypothetical protein [Thermomonas mangrovi]